MSSNRNMNNNESAMLLIEQRADPWIYRHLDGFYYFTASVPEYDRIELRRSLTLQGLVDVEPLTVWRKHASGPLSANIWAPEIHFMDGKWYIYFAAARSSETVEGLFDHRMYVLENRDSNPLEGEWIEKGQLRTDWESFSLDATHFEHKGKHYLVWAQRDPAVAGNSNLYIAPLKNGWTLGGKQIMLTKPEYEWEIIGFRVNEGAAVIKKNGRIFISYSASATNSNYCVGLLWANADSDLLNPGSWTKSQVPVLTTDEQAGRYGPGHNSFTIAEDGSTDILVYHARTYKEISGDPLYDPNRHTWIKRLNWDREGMPRF